MDPNSFVQLRWDQIQAPYSLILNGKFDVEALQSFCAAIRWAFDQYHASAARFPERLQSGAQACVAATEQVLKTARARGASAEGDAAAWTKVLKALERHLANFRAELKESKRRSQELAKSQGRRLAGRAPSLGARAVWDYALP